MLLEDLLHFNHHLLDDKEDKNSKDVWFMLVKILLMSKFEPFPLLRSEILQQTRQIVEVWSEEVEQEWNEDVFKDSVLLNTPYVLLHGIQKISIHKLIIIFCKKYE